MKSILSIVFVLALLSVKSQNNLVVFSENGEKFFLIVNGVKQNINAETNVKVTDLMHPNYKLKVEFEDKTKGVVNQNLYFMYEGEEVKNHEFVFSLNLNKKAVYKMRPVSAASIADTKPTANQSVVHYSTVEPTTQTSNTGGNVNSSVNVSGTDNADVNTNIHVTETVTQTQVNNGNTSVGVNVGGVGVNININDNVGGLGGQTTAVTSQTVTTTTKTSGSYNSQSTVSGSSAASNNGTTMQSSSSSACTAPISAKEFSSVKASIESKSFEDSKIKIAKQVMDNNCLSTAQVKEIMLLFSFEATRLDLAKYAYGHTFDTKNYYKLNDAFSFESSIDELDTYIKENK